MEQVGKGEIIGPNLPAWSHLKMHDTFYMWSQTDIPCEIFVQPLRERDYINWQRVSSPCTVVMCDTLISIIASQYGSYHNSISKW